jgi:hypothetical protein
MKRSLLIGMAGLWTAAIVLTFAGSLAAQARHCFFIDGKLVCVNVAPGGEVTPENVAAPGSDDSGSPLGTWRSLPLSPVDGLWPCVDANGNPSNWWVLSFFPNDRSQPITNELFCEAESGIPVVPPAPPTPEEAWQAVPIAEPSININPDGLGATGIETWLWGSSADPVSVSVTVRGYTVTGVASPTEWQWNMGSISGTSNPSPALRASTPGSSQAPAGRYTYETKGSYTITHEVTWSGTFTVTGWGLPALPLNAGIIVVESSRPYQVVEIRSVRLPAEGSG